MPVAWCLADPKTGEREAAAERGLWRDGVEDGEDLGHLTVRVDAFLGRVRPLLDKGDVAVVAHGHLSRILTARLPATATACRCEPAITPGTSLPGPRRAA